MRLKIQQFMMRYLRKRGWVVFYLDESSRTCNNVCWLGLYQDAVKKSK